MDVVGEVMEMCWDGEWDAITLYMGEDEDGRGWEVEERTRQHEETRYGNMKSRFKAQSRIACKLTYAINKSP